MVLFDVVKEEQLSSLTITPGSTLGGDDDTRIDPDNYWIELVGRATNGTFTGGTSPAWDSDAGDALVSALTLNLGGSVNPITNTSVKNLKRLAQLEYGEEVMADGYWSLAFGGAFPAFLFENGIRFKHSFDTLANLTTGSPTSQSGTKIDYFLRKFPRQGRPGNTVGFPVIKTVTKDVQSVEGRKVIADLNSGNLLRHMLVIPSSGTLINSLEVSIADGEDILRDVPWEYLRELNKRDYFFDSREAATGFGALSFPNLITDKERVGKLQLFADIESEADGQITVVTMERMNPRDEGVILSKIAQ